MNQATTLPKSPGSAGNAGSKARYSLVNYSEACEEVRALYDDFLRSTGSTTVPIWVQSLGSNKTLLHAYWERTKGSLVLGNLPGLLKEMVIFVVSVENGSRYCSACHAHAVLSLDPTLSFDDLNLLLDSNETQLNLPRAYREALNFALVAAKDPNLITDENFVALRDAGYSEDEIHELLSVIDLAKMFNAYTSTLALPLDPEYRAILEPV